MAEDMFGKGWSARRTQGERYLSNIEGGGGCLAKEKETLDFSWRLLSQVLAYEAKQ